MTTELPPNWYKNNGLLGFSLFRVFGKSNDLTSVGHLIIKGNDKEKSLDSFSLGYSNLDPGKQNTTWIMCYPKVAIRERYRSNQWTHIRATYMVKWKGAVSILYMLKMMNRCNHQWYKAFLLKFLRSWNRALR